MCPKSSLVAFFVSINAAIASLPVVHNSNENISGHNSWNRCPQGFQPVRDDSRQKYRSCSTSGDCEQLHECTEIQSPIGTGRYCCPSKAFICGMSPNYGEHPCKGRPKRRYYFSTVTHQCEPVTFSGCGLETGNLFNSSLACYHFCSDAACPAHQIAHVPAVAISCSVKESLCPKGTSCVYNNLTSTNVCCEPGKRDYHFAELTDEKPAKHRAFPFKRNRAVPKYEPMHKFNMPEECNPGLKNNRAPFTTTESTPATKSSPTAQTSAWELILIPNTLTTTTIPNLDVDLKSLKSRGAGLCAIGSPLILGSNTVAYCKKDDHCPATHSCDSGLCCPRAAHACSLDYDMGRRCRPGQRPEIRWYYDDIAGICRSFGYLGCEGNANRFRSKRRCEMICWQASRRRFRRAQSQKGQKCAIGEPYGLSSDAVGLQCLDNQDCPDLHSCQSNVCCLIEAICPEGEQLMMNYTNNKPLVCNHNEESFGCPMLTLCRKNEKRNKLYCCL